MDVELFIYGVPSGESFWGPKEEEAYFGNFYNGIEDYPTLFIQVRPLKGKMYCYYNYLISKNVVGNGGRAGSFFGISLRLDAFCKDVFAMHRVLDTACLLSMGTLLKAEGGNLKYVVAKFSSVDGKIKEIRDQVFQLFGKVFTDKSFLPIDNTFKASNKGGPKYNLYDCTQDNALDAIRKYGVMAISSYYPSKTESDMKQRCDDRIREVQQQCDNSCNELRESCSKEKDELNQKIGSLQQQLEKTESDLKGKNATIQKYNDKIKHLEGELKTIERTKKVSQIVSQIKEPIAQLAVLLRQAEPPFIPTTEPEPDIEDEESPFVRKIGTIVKLLFFIAKYAIIAFVVYSSYQSLNYIREKKSDNKEEAFINHGGTDNVEYSGQAKQEEDSI